ncbi:hypothetical protein PBRA_006109 [Plasmodiophora brassicae]|uniref:Uncharacterized protein n=1 Tax=Plasmodiophora brassicae TaxID=37360 RepID=A0A0G4IRV2_PLABS|nr:hypothetical protein PBRA_006109 [Plasmodiophora brassicae]
MASYRCTPRMEARCLRHRRRRLRRSGVLARHIVSVHGDFADGLAGSVHRIGDGRRVPAVDGAQLARFDNVPVQDRVALDGQHLPGGHLDGHQAPEQGQDERGRVLAQPGDSAALDQIVVHLGCASLGQIAGQIRDMRFVRARRSRVDRWWAAANVRNLDSLSRRAWARWSRSPIIDAAVAVV